MKKIFGMIFLMLCFLVPFFIETDDVLAEDITYNVALEEGYTYGDIQKCTTYYKGNIRSVNNTTSDGSYNMCLYNTEKYRDYNHPHDKIECSDSSMDLFKITVSGSNGATYYGYSCRKPNTSDNIETKKETINVGQMISIPDTTDYETNKCSIVSGDAGHFEENFLGNLTCTFVADKEGVVVVKATTNNKETVYYEYNIIDAFSLVADLDQNYFYGSVDSCYLTREGYKTGDKQNFDNLVFCGTVVGDPDIESLSCVDEGYEAFSLKFSSDGKLYYGYGCRKPKSNDVIDYIENNIIVGDSFRVADATYNTCSIISGTAGSFNTSSWDTYFCDFTARKEGIVEVKVVNKKNSIATYYRYIIGQNPNDTDYNSQTFKDLICEVKSVLIKKGSNLDNLAQIKLSGILYDISAVDCSSNIKCDENSCDYILEQKLKNTANYCNEIYSQSYNYNDGSNYTSRLDECVQFKDFYSSLVTNGIIKDLQDGCEILSDDLVDKLVWVLDIIKIAGPILAVGLGTLDFVKVVASGDTDKEMKSAFKRFGTRIIAAVLLFLIPVILAFLMDTFLGNQSGYDSDNPFCDIVKFNE